MRFNTIVNYPMTAGYRTWEPETRDDTLTYRSYGDPQEIKCTIVVTITGNLALMAAEPIQQFAIVHSLQDAGGKAFMDDVWYSVQRIIPVFDGAGYLTSYRHQLAILAPELVGKPIDPPQQYPGVDQQA